MLTNNPEDNAHPPNNNNNANITNNDVIDMYLNANETKLPSYDEFNMMIESIRGKLNITNNVNGVKSKVSCVNGSNVDHGGKYSQLLMLINRDNNVNCECKDKSKQTNEMSLSAVKKKRKTLIRSGSVVNENGGRKERFYILNGRTTKNGLVKVFSQLNCGMEGKCNGGVKDSKSGDDGSKEEYKLSRCNSSGVNVMNWVENEKRNQKDKGGKQQNGSNNSGGNKNRNNDNDNGVMQRKVSFDKAYFSSKLNIFSYKLFGSNSSNTINVPASSKHRYTKHQLDPFFNNWY